MNIIKRISRLFVADLHGVLDTLEEPETQLKQAIREMEAHLQDAEVELNSLASSRITLERQQQYIHRQEEELQSQLTLCFEEHNDDLAKSVLRKKLQQQKQLQTLEHQLSALAEHQLHRQAEVEEQQEKLRTIKDKLELLQDSHTQPEYRNTEANTASSVNQDDIDVAFLHEKQRFQQKQSDQEPDHE